MKNKRSLIFLIPLFSYYLSMLKNDVSHIVSRTVSKHKYQKYFSVKIK